jgi:hypothetical protein
MEKQEKPTVTGKQLVRVWSFAAAAPQCIYTTPKLEDYMRSCLWAQILGLQRASSLTLSLVHLLK